MVCAAPRPVETQPFSGRSRNRLCDLDVVEEIDGIGMTDYDDVSGRTATAETAPLTDDEFERKLSRC